MKISYAKGRSQGVGTLVYVGDATTPPGPTNIELAAGAVGALAALMGTSALTKVAGAAIAGYVGFDLYQARKQTG